MTEPRDDRAEVKEAATLLGLDVERLSPADALRVDMVSSLRLVIDSEQASILSGNSADLGKLNVAVQSLISLLPGNRLPEPAPVDGGPSDPRRIMWENYKRMRDRGAAFGEGYDGLKLENERLKARVAELEAGGATAVPPAPLPDNVVPLARPPAAAAPAPAAPATGIITDNVDEPWRPFVSRFEV
jgi:hypothetical protein